MGAADIELEARVAKSDNKVLAQEKTLLDSLPKRSDTPVGKLMNGDQAELFGRLNAQLMAFSLEDLIESAQPMPKVRNAAPLQLYGYLRFVTQTKPTVQVPAMRPTGCSVDDALAAEIFDADERLKAFSSAILQASQRTTDAIKARYGSLDAPSMTAADREAIAMARNAIRPALADITLESDLQNLRDWWAIAEQVHDDRLADVREYGADPNVLGKTEEADYPKRTPRDQMLFRSWDMVNEKMPSGHEVMMEANAKMLAEANKAQEATASSGAGHP